MSSIFSSPDSETSFRAHVAQAAPFVRFGVRTALVLRRIFGPRASTIPVVKIACGPLESLLAMHNAAVDHRPPPAPAASCSIANDLAGSWDLCVVGSGPGGAVAARAAAERGERVVVIEAGHGVDDTVEHHTVAQMMSDFAFGGQEVVLGPSPVPYAQGRAWGGGSEINSGLYHHAPDHVAERWRSAAGISGDEYAAAVADVESRLPIAQQPASSLGCYRDSPIEAIRSHLDWHGGVIPRWREYGAHGFRHFGMSATYLAAAVDRGAMRVVGHSVRRVTAGPDGVVVHVSGPECSHDVAASDVVLAAGVIGTPEVLSRSRLASPGEFAFAFHAMIREVARYQRDVNDLEDIDPHQAWTADNRFKIGAAVSTTELLAATMAQKNQPPPPDPEHYAAIYISFASDGRNGLFRLGGKLYPYFVPSRAMRDTASQAGGLLRAAIAATGGEVSGDPKNGYSTVHVFGSLPLGASRVVDRRGVVRGTHGRVRVRDASILPSHPLVNPQGPLMHLVTALETAHVGART